ncbi:MAG: chorismate synthase [Bacteroidetes bacterium]|nr:chorismate synthase [Bacteroidota bacterium]MCL2301850.1 chorismate synthase [Lentimicrobiaceae bacterium]
MNSFGTSFILSDYGGTHDPHIGGTITGCPADIEIDFEFIQSELARRAPSQHPNSTQRREPDHVEFLSGIENGKTTGAPIEFRIQNEDVQPNKAMLHVIKPSHASYTYKIKYGITDNSGTGRASARQTACRVVGGAIAKLYLKKFGIEIHAWEKGKGRREKGEKFLLLSEEKVADGDLSASDGRGDDGDTFGALVHCTIKNLPAGLGEPVYDKFDARLAYAMLSINACKGFEIGKGFEAANMKGSEYNDIQNPDFSFQSNNDGGVQAGITNGQEVYFSVAFKPVPTLQMKQSTIDFDGKSTTYIGNNRNDRCVAPRVLPVVEAMAALVVADFMLS